MNNKTILAIALLLAGTLFTATSTMTMAPAYAGGDDDRKGGDDKRKGGDGNKQKVEDESAGSIADCDKNEVEEANFECIAASATEESTVGVPDDVPDDADNGAAECEACIQVFLTALEGLELTTGQEAAINAALEVFGDCDEDFTEEDVEILATALIEILGTVTGGEVIVMDLEECLDAILGGIEENG